MQIALKNPLFVTFRSLHLRHRRDLLRVLLTNCQCVVSVIMVSFSVFHFIFSSLRLLSQSSQSWLRACGLLWTTRPSVPLISGARSRDTLPNSWAASKSSLSPSALTLCAQSTWKKNDCWFRGVKNELSLSTLVSLQSTGRPGVSALLIGRPPQWGEQSDGPPEGVRRGLWPPLVSQHPPMSHS